MITESLFISHISHWPMDWKQRWEYLKVGMESTALPYHCSKGGDMFPVVQIQGGGTCISMVSSMSTWRPHTSIGCVISLSQQLLPKNLSIQNGLKQQFIIMSHNSVSWLSSAGYFFCSSHLGPHFIVIGWLGLDSFESSTGIELKIASLLRSGPLELLHLESHSISIFPRLLFAVVCSDFL